MHAGRGERPRSARLAACGPLPFTRVTAVVGEPSGVPAARHAGDCTAMRAMAAEIEQALERVESEDGRAVLLDLRAAYRAAIDGYAVMAACGPLRPS